MRQRLAAILRWIGVPWREFAVAAALIGAAAAPAVLVTAADVWRAAAGDDFTRRTVATLTDAELGLRIDTNAVMAASTTEAADAIVSQRIRNIDGLTDPIPMTWTLRASGVMGPDRRNPGVPLRVMARPGALDAIEVVESDPSIEGGVWVTTFIAERTGASVGDILEFDSPLEPEDPGAEMTPTGGPTASWPIAGIYVPLWQIPDGEGDPYWDEVPADLVPRGLSVFDEPNFSLLLLDEATMRASRLRGYMQWDAIDAEAPGTLSELETRVRAYRGLESDLVRDFEVASALSNLAAFEPATPSLTTRLFDAYDDVTASTRRLEEPLAAARAGGVAVGLAVVLAGALFAVQRRRIEYRLLAGEGDRWPIMSARGVLQLAAPIAVGTAVGVVVGVAVGLWLGPAPSLRFDVVDGVAIAIVATAGLVLAAVATGIAGQRTLDLGTIGRSGGGASIAIVATFVAATAFLWYQAAAIPPAVDDSVDLTVIALPLVALTTGVVVVVAGLSALVRLGRGAGGRLPLPLFLAWRRMTRSDVTNALIIGSVGIGIGLVTLSFMLVASLDRINDVKLAARVGAQTAVELVSLPRDATSLPPESTIVSFDPVRIDPGDRPGRVFAVDTDEYASIVDWPVEFGPGADEVMRLLSDADVGDSLPVVAVEGSGIAPTGVFGAQSFPYTIVGVVRSVPLAYEFGATLLVDADRLNDYAFDRLTQRLADRMDEEPSPDVVAAMYGPPTDGYRHVLVSRSTEDVVTDWLLETALPSRVLVSRAELDGTIDVLAPRIAFDYLRVLGIVAGVAALASVVLHLAARRRRRMVAASMTRRMGLSSRTASAATALEVMAMLAIAVGVGIAVAVAVAHRLLPRFDPAPTIPPGPSITTGPAELLAWAIAIVAVVTAVVWLIDWAGARRLTGGVRGAD